MDNNTETTINTTTTIVIPHPHHHYENKQGLPKHGILIEEIFKFIDWKDHLESTILVCKEWQQALNNLVINLKIDPPALFTSSLLLDDERQSTISSGAISPTISPPSSPKASNPLRNTLFSEEYETNMKIGR